MSFLSSLKIVSLYDNALPQLNRSAIDKLPAKTQMLELFGGKGGNIGEKSYKPVIQFEEGVGTPNSALDVNTEPRFFAKEIKNENDCGHAIKIIQNSTNKSKVNIGYINPTSGISIYSSSEQLKFANLYSGVATTATTYSNNATVESFTVKTNGTETIETYLDSELGLNKYYFDLNGAASGDTCTKFITKNNLNLSTDTTSLLNVFVNEIDVNENYVSYITSGAGISKSSTTGSITITIETGKAFASGDIIIIGDITNDANYVYGTVTSYTSGTGSLTFSISNWSENKVDLPIGSFVTIYQIYQWLPTIGVGFSHCISTTWTNDGTPAASSLRESYSSVGLDGFRFKYKRSKTNNSILDYKNQFAWCKNSYIQNISSGASQTEFQANIVNNSATADPNFNFERIGNRSYLKSQYNGLPELIKKNKFSIIYNGFYQYNSQYKYFHGYYKSNLIDIQLQDSMLADPKNYLITVGSGAYKYDINNFRPYFSHKLYEILSYRNIQDLNTGRPQNIIVDYLIQKYKEKALFGSSEIQNDKDIYYSQVDRPNIFGKINKFIL